LVKGRLQGDLDCTGYYLDDFAVGPGQAEAAKSTVEHSSASATYVKVAAIAMRRKMKANISADIKIDTLGQTAYVMLYIDGVQIAGTEQTTISTSYETLNWSNIEVEDGEELQIYVHSSDGIAFAYQNNFVVKIQDYADCYVSLE